MGSNFIRHIHETYPDYIIHNLDLLTYAGNLDNLTDLSSSPRYRFIHGDIGDELLIMKTLYSANYDVVINFAAESHVDRSIMDAFQFIKTNIQGSFILLEAVKNLKVPRFIYISTDEVYGDVEKGVKTDENYPLIPSNPYAASKAAADLMIQAYVRTHKIPAIILRSSNNYGPFQYPEKLHSLIITSLLEGRKIPVHGKGSHLRSWIHVMDFCYALDLIMHQSEAEKIYNICGEERSNLDVIATIVNIMGMNLVDVIEYVDDRPGADFRYAPDHSLITKELGWERKFNYDESAKDVISWYKENTSWWQKIKSKTEFQIHFSKQSKGEYDL